MNAYPSVITKVAGKQLADMRAHGAPDDVVLDLLYERYYDTDGIAHMIAAEAIALMLTGNPTVKTPTIEREES